MVNESRGQFSIPEGYEPQKVDDAWDKMMDALKDRETLVTQEYKRFVKNYFSMLNKIFFYFLIMKLICFYLIFLR